MMGNAHGPSEITMGLGNQALFVGMYPLNNLIAVERFWCMVHESISYNMEAVHVRAKQIFTSGAVLQKLSNLQVISIQIKNSCQL